MLSGFLAPDGAFTKCDIWEHLETARHIAAFKHEQCLNRIAAENYLYENGYIEFTARGASKRFIVGEDRHFLLLTEEQKNFLLDNLENANNLNQKNDMLQILQYHNEMSEDLMLYSIENKYIKSPL